MARPIDYSRWKDIEVSYFYSIFSKYVYHFHSFASQVSDDEDDTHPNIDTPSLFRWRHKARLEKMAELENEKKRLEEEKRKIESEKKWVAQKMSSHGNQGEVKELDPEVESVIKKLEDEEKKLSSKEEEVKKKEKLMPWNVDTISHDGFEKTIINKPKPQVDRSQMSEEEQEAFYKDFVKKNEKSIKAYGMLSKWDDSKQFLLENNHLVCEETANYLAIWCLDLAMEEKTDLMEHIAKQVISMQFILELAKQLKCDPRSCISSFFTRIKTAEKEYQDGFEAELASFKNRIKVRAKEKLDALMKEIEEEEKQKRLGPGGLDPVEVYETLPESMRKCFDDRDIERLQGVLQTMDITEAKYHMKRCIDSGMWVPDASAQSIFNEPDSTDQPVAEEAEKEDQIYEQPTHEK